MKYSDLTVEEKKYLCNGAGRRGWQGKIIPEFVFTESANRHDFDYWQGCTEEDRLDADRRFLENMLDAAEYKTNKDGTFKFHKKGKKKLLKKRRFILFRIFYRRMALRYYAAVRELGGTKTLGGFHYAMSKRTKKDLKEEMKSVKK